MQVIFARMSLDEIVEYITVELKLNAKNEADVQDRHGHGHRGHREDRQHREVGGTRSAPRRKGMEAAKISGPRPPARIMKKPTSSRL